MALVKLKASEKLDREGMRLVRDQTFTTTRNVVKAVGKPAYNRLMRCGYIVLDEKSEYSDVLRLTFDGEDYLTVLEEPWHD